MPIEQMLSEKQLSELWSIDKDTLRRWRRNRVLPSYKMGRSVRYKQSDVQDFLKASEIRQ